MMPHARINQRLDVIKEAREAVAGINFIKLHTGNELITDSLNQKIESIIFDLELQLDLIDAQQVYRPEEFIKEYKNEE